MRNFKLAGVLILLSVFVVSCKDGRRGPLTPTSSGLPYELLVVIDQKYQDTELGTSITDVLTRNVPGLPQPESSFKLMYTDPQHFDGILKPIRNIVIVKIGKEYTEPRFNSISDLYAFPQAVLVVQGPDLQSAADYVLNNSAAMIDYFTKAEMNRQITILEKNHNDEVSKMASEMFGVEVWIPGDLMSTKRGENFLWAGSNTGKAERYFMIYSIPYTDKDAFTPEYMLHKRDSVLKVNIPGEREGTYMTTSRDYTDVKPISVQREYAMEARGLWRVVNDRMGGPFVAQMRLDEKNNRLIFVDAFVFAPEKSKRNLMKQLEASLYTLRLPGALAKEVEITEAKPN